MAIHSLQDLFEEQLKDMYSAETQFMKAMPKMKERASDKDLKKAFETHIEETKKQVERLERIGEILGVSLTGHKCHAAEGLVKEGQELMEECKDDAVCDAGLIAAAQRVEHYEISGYGTCRAYAQELGHDEVHKILSETLDEEEHADELLNKLATKGINQAAAS